MMTYYCKNVSCCLQMAPTNPLPQELTTMKAYAGALL